MSDEVPVRSHLDFNGNEIRNVSLEKLLANPVTPVVGGVYSINNVPYFYNGTNFLRMDIQLATDTEATTGTNTTKAVTPRQLSVKANINSPTFTGTPKVPTASTGTSTTQAASTAFVAQEIAAAVLNAKIYKGVWNTTNQTNFDGLNSYRPIKAGWYFDVTGSGCTIDGIEFKAGDAITFKNDVASGVTITSAMISKTDNTESTDIVKLDATQTLTNKTIDASENTFSNLEINDFKSGEFLTTATANSAKGITSGAVFAALSSKQDKITAGTGISFSGNTLNVDNPFISLAAGSMVYGNTGGVLTELAKGSAGFVLTMDDNGAFPVWKRNEANIKKQTFDSPALTPTDGVCTWTIDHSFNTKDITIRVYEVSTGENVLLNIATNAASQVTIKFNAVNSVAAGTYRAVLVG